MEEETFESQQDIPKEDEDEPGEETEQSTSQVVSNRTKDKSIVQKFFDKNGPFKARCKKCSSELAVKGGCTSTLLRHLKARHPHDFEAASSNPEPRQKKIFECFTKDGKLINVCENLCNQLDFVELFNLFHQKLQYGIGRHPGGLKVVQYS